MAITRSFLVILLIVTTQAPVMAQMKANTQSRMGVEHVAPQVNTSGEPGNQGPQSVKPDFNRFFNRYSTQHSETSDKDKSGKLVNKPLFSAEKPNITERDLAKQESSSAGSSLQHTFLIGQDSNPEFVRDDSGQRKDNASAAPDITALSANLKIQRSKTQERLKTAVGIATGEKAAHLTALASSTDSVYADLENLTQALTDSAAPSGQQQSSNSQFALNSNLTTRIEAQTKSAQIQAANQNQQKNSDNKEQLDNKITNKNQLKNLEIKNLENTDNKLTNKNQLKNLENTDNKLTNKDQLNSDNAYNKLANKDELKNLENADNKLTNTDELKNADNAYNKLANKDELKNLENADNKLANKDELKDELKNADNAYNKLANKDELKKMNQRQREELAGQLMQMSNLLEEAMTQLGEGQTQEAAEAQMLQNQITNLMAQLTQQAGSVQSAESSAESSFGQAITTAGETIANVVNQAITSLLEDIPGYVK